MRYGESLWLGTNPNQTKSLEDALQKPGWEGGSPDLNLTAAKSRVQGVGYNNFILFLKRWRKDSSAVLVTQYYAGVRLGLSVDTKLKREKRAKFVCTYLLSKVIIHAQVTVNKDKFISSIVLSSNGKSDRFPYIAFDPFVANNRDRTVKNMTY